MSDCWKKEKKKYEWKKGKHTVRVQLLDGLRYVRVFENGFLTDSLAEGNKVRAIKSAKSYMKKHGGVCSR